MALRITAITVAVLLAFAAPAVGQPRLSYSAAKRAAQVKSDGFAGVPTRITALYRLGQLTYSARAEWERVNPSGCKGCGFDPITGGLYDTPTTEYCSLGLRAKRLQSGQVRISVEDSACF